MTDDMHTSRSRPCTRRTLLQVSAAGLAAGLAAPAVLLGRGARAEETLTWSSWPEYAPRSLLDEFKAETGISVVINAFDQPADPLNKLRAGGPAVDLVTLSWDQRASWLAANVLQKFDAARVEKERILPPFRRLFEDDEAGERPDRWDQPGSGDYYFVPIAWGAEGLVWLPDRWPFDEPPKSFGDLWRPEVEGMIGGPAETLLLSIGLYLDATGGLPVALEEDSDDEQTMRMIWSAILEFAIERRSAVRSFWAYDIQAVHELLSSGEVTLGVALDSHVRALRKEGLSIEFVAPSEGGITWVDCVALPVGAQNPDAAYKLIAFLHQPEKSALLATEANVNPLVSDAFDKLPEEFGTFLESTYLNQGLEGLWLRRPVPEWYTRAKREFIAQYEAA